LVVKIISVVVHIHSMFFFSEVTGHECPIHKLAREGHFWNI